MRKFGLGADNALDVRMVDAKGRFLTGTQWGRSSTRPLEQGATKLLYKWQKIAPKLDDRLFLRVMIQASSTNLMANRTVTTSYNALFLGDLDTLLGIMSKRFPELGITRADCTKMSWIRSVLYMALYPNTTAPEVLLQGSSSFRATSSPSPTS
ncbi:hypothetical protein NL676_009070 [Syzygium grande]|nr:hypothetical protein NL676_009070 [Syzygium grande]